MDLTFELEDFADPHDDRYFAVLQDNNILSIGMDDEKIALSMAIAAKQIAAILPASGTYNVYVAAFTSTCCQVAEQIPYNSHAMLHERLVKLIEMVLQSERFSRRCPNGIDHAPWRYQKVKEEMYDRWTGKSPEEDGEKYLNYQYFSACFFDAGIMNCHTLIAWTLREAFPPAKEIDDGFRARLGRWFDGIIGVWSKSTAASITSGNEKLLPTTEAEQMCMEAYVVASAIWIEKCGWRLYHEIRNKGEDATWLGKNPRGRWQEVTDRFREIACAHEAGIDGLIWSERCQGWAWRAFVEMERVEKEHDA